MQCRILFHDRELQRFDWCKLADDEDIDVECASADAEQLASVCAQSTQVIVFLPQKEILLSTPVLPPRANKQQLGAIAYTLEESLAQDVDDCFFAMMPQQADQRVPVAVIERSIMDEVIALLNRHHVNARQILPAACLCPWAEDDALLASVCSTGSELLIRYGQHHALSCQPSVAPQILSQLAKNIEAAGQRVDVYGVDALAGEHPQQGYSVQSLATIKLLAQPLDSVQCINLKQKEYLSSHHWSGLLKRWQWPLVLLLSLLVLWLAGNLVDSWKKQRQLDDLIRQQQQLLAQYLPDIRAGEHPKDQLVKYLSQQRGAQGQQGFIDLLYEFSRLKSDYKQISIEKIVYQKGQLIANLEAANLNAMEGFRLRLSKARFKSEIDNVNINPDKTTGRLVMREAQ